MDFYLVAIDDQGEITETLAGNIVSNRGGDPVEILSYSGGTADATAAGGDAERPAAVVAGGGSGAALAGLNPEPDSDPKSDAEVLFQQAWLGEKFV